MDLYLLSLNKQCMLNPCSCEWASDGRRDSLPDVLGRVSAPRGPGHGSAVRPARLSEGPGALWPRHLLIRLNQISYFAFRDASQTSGTASSASPVSLPFPAFHNCRGRLPWPTHQESALTKVKVAVSLRPAIRRAQNVGQDCRPGFCVPTCFLFLGPLRSRRPFAGRQRPSPRCSPRTAIHARSGLRRDLPLCQGPAALLL